MERAEDGKVAAIEDSLNLAGEFKINMSKVTWVGAVDGALDGGLGPCALRLLDFDYLITKPKLEESDNFEAVVNTVTRTEVSALGEAAMRCLQRGDVIQIERKGYYRVDEPLQDEGKAMVLFAIPDGKPRTTGVSSVAGGGGSSSGGGRGRRPGPLPAAPAGL
jgi:glutamyl-tRNA synthetase